VGRGFDSLQARHPKSPPNAQSPQYGAGIAVSDADNQGRAYLQAAPHIVLVPSLAIMLAVLAFNLFGDGLNDALNPRLRDR
jgi:ABC-type dipeptide/oligopeptide/nickel transport system permease subunit